MTLPWWREDEYTKDVAVPSELVRYSGPKGVALVRAWESGQTSKGWGESMFMDSYMKGRFNAKPFLPGYKQGRWALAYVMRSLRLVCIDIDGKNGGFDNTGKLGMLPHTLAETSKSGNGYHLFYLVGDDLWNLDKGYAMFGDRIGLVQGVDLRAVGCVYHFPQQRWNGREIAPLPEHLKNKLLDRKNQVDAQVDEIIKLLDAGDPVEVAIMQDTLITDLNKPIPSGRRNTTLFAIGSQMHLAQVPGWKQLVHDRALALGLDIDEADKLISNIEKYAA
jgi:hypothetical protein